MTVFSALHRFTLMTLLCLGGLAQASAAQAADTPATYTTRAGDTLEKIATRQYPSSPLQAQVLAQVLAQTNAAAVGGTAPRKRLKAGMVLDVPSHETVVRQVFAPYVHQANAHASSPEARRNWVHYP